MERRPSAFIVARTRIIKWQPVGKGHSTHGFYLAHPLAATSQHKPRCDLRDPDQQEDPRIRVRVRVRVSSSLPGPGTLRMQWLL